MPLFDKIKAQAAQAAKMAQEAGKAGQAKIDQVQAKRQLDALYRDLGAAVYADRSGQSTTETAPEIDRLVTAITAHLEENGSDAGDETDGPSPSATAPVSEPPKASYGS